MSNSTAEQAQEFKKLYGPFFTYEEFACKCAKCKDARLNGADFGGWFVAYEFRAFMKILIELRIEGGFPFKINSGYRCPAHNRDVSSTGLDGPHTLGAADIQVTHERAYKLNKMASARDLGLGPNQKGDLAKRFFHVDNIGPRLWTY